MSRREMYSNCTGYNPVRHLNIQIPHWSKEEYNLGLIGAFLYFWHSWTSYDNIAVSKVISWLWRSASQSFTSSSRQVNWGFVHLFLFSFDVVNLNFLLSPKSSIRRKNKSLTVMRHPNVPPQVYTWRSRTYFHACWGETTYASPSVHKRNKMQASWCEVTDGLAASSNANNYMQCLQWWKGSIVNVSTVIKTHISKRRRDRALINVLP